MSLEQHPLPLVDALLDEPDVLLGLKSLLLLLLRLVLEDELLLLLDAGGGSIGRGESGEVGELVSRGHQVDVEVVDVLLG